MVRWLLVAAILLAAPGAALAETCNSNASFRWTALATTVPASQWTGCTPTTDDNFHVLSGHRVIVDGSVLFTAGTGNVQVETGGTLVVTAGSILTPGDFLRVEDGGTLEAQGAVRNICRIATEPNWGAAVGANPVLTLGCDTALSATTSDYLVFLAPDDPPDGNFTGHTVKLGPGLVPGARNTALNRYAWYDITATGGACPGAACGQVTIDLDSGTYVAPPDAPYQGERDNPTAAVLAPADLSEKPREGGLYTRLTIATTSAGCGTACVNMHADLGSYYLQYIEDVANAADPTFCSGLAAKILHSENDNAGGDQLYVMGDVSGCTNGSARITPGMRRGDQVAIVTPATIDGFITAAPHTSFIEIHSGATVHIRWARLNRLGVGQRQIDFSPTIQRNCNVCLLQSSTNPTGTITGWIADTEIAFPEADGTTDTAVFYPVSQVQPVEDLRFPDAGPLDLSGLEVERLHIHDSRNATPTSGSHGIYPSSVRNFTVDGARVERMSDDGVGGQLITNTTGTSVLKSSAALKRILTYENIAEDDTSQDGFEFAHSFGINNAVTGEDNFSFNAGAWSMQDIVTIGARGTVLTLQGLGHKMNRFVASGSFVGTSGVFQATCSGTFAPELDGMGATRPRIFRNGLVTSMQSNGVGGSIFGAHCGAISDSIFFGNAQSSDATDTLSGDTYNHVVTCARSAFLHQSGHAAGATTVVNSGGPIDLLIDANRSYTDCALISLDASAGAATGNSATGTFTFAHTRTLFATNHTDFATGGPDDLGSGTVTPIINGFRAIAAAPGTNASWTNLDAGGSVVNACVGVNAVADAWYGSYAGPSNVTNPDLFPKAADQTKIGALVQNPKYALNDPCEAAKPKTLGLSEIGMAHVMLGDFFLLQLNPTYTSCRGLVTLVSE